MGIGIWYEMWISDPVSYLFKNTDPRGSLRANVSNATVRCLSNMKLAEMMETRHNMSQTVRAEVTDKSQAWGYQLGSVYIRKVHFRDVGMIHQIEEKVVNRLRQVTSAIRQAGSNQVSVITSSAEREAAIEFAKAAAIRPATLGQAFQEIAREPEVATALFDVLETQRILASSEIGRRPSSSPKRRPSGRRRWDRPSRKSRANRRWPRRCSTCWRRSGFWRAVRRSHSCRAGRTAGCWPI